MGLVCCFIIKGMIYYMVSGVKILRKAQRKNMMASKQIIMNETIAKAATEVTRVVIQAMAATTAERPQGVAGPKIGKPVMKQPTSKWEMEDKYNKLKTFRLEVNNILSTYNMPITE